MHTRLLLAATAAVLAACSGPRLDLAATQHLQSFNDFDRQQVKQAPPVADAVTSARIANARSEPQNWLTYYGAYDGQRYSSLDQINAGNVAQLRPAWVFQAAPIGLIASPPTFSLE